MNQKVLILTGDGINCERESARAFADAGGDPTLLHVNELLKEPAQLLNYSVLCVPGGFSFGDELRSGKILAEKMREHLSAYFQKFTESGGLTLGICNGFQVLVQLGVFETASEKRTVTLATNDHGKFMNQWVELEISEDAQRSPWFKGMSGKLLLPMRHKEGRIVVKRIDSTLPYRIPLRYSSDVNGSYQRAAALLDQSGQILGIMPHPEAATHVFLNSLHHPEVSAEENAVLVRKIFTNAVNRGLNS